jgi:calcineurin-like phosphoesterase
MGPVCRRAGGHGHRELPRGLGWEKMEFATAVDGSVAAVLGTHTHEPTANLYVLPGGTALVVNVGMTGPSGSPVGSP